MYVPTIARWMSVDPLAEKYDPMGGYGYCAGSPIILVDPDGSIIGSPYPPYPTGLYFLAFIRGLGENAAIEIGNAHEDALPGDLNQRSFDSIDTADQMTDLLNNEIGRSIGLKNTNASNKSFSEAILKEFKENGLWVSHQIDDKCFVIRRETLSQSKYEAALKVIGNKGENGLNIK